MRVFWKKNRFFIIFIFFISNFVFSQSFDKKEVSIKYEKIPEIKLPSNIKKYYCEINCKSTSGYLTSNLTLGIGYIEIIGKINAFNGLPTTQKRWINSQYDIKKKFLTIKGLEMVDNKNEADLIIIIDFGWVEIYRNQEIGRNVSLSNRDVFEMGYEYQFFCDNKLTIKTKNDEILYQSNIRDRSNPYYLKAYEREYTTIDSKQCLIFDMITQDILSKVQSQLEKYSSSSENKKVYLFKPEFKNYSYKDISKANDLILETTFFFMEEKNINFPKVNEAILIYEKALLEESKLEKNSRINSEIAEYIHSNLVFAYWIVGNNQKAKENISHLINYSETKKVAASWSNMLN